MNRATKISMKILQVAIEDKKKLLECYEIRLHLIDTDKVNKSEYDINELKIVKLQTQSLIRILVEKINQLEDEFIKVFYSVLNK
jgi:hypothetical protein